MGSNVRKIVEPALGWLFVVAVITVMGAAMLAAMRPRADLAHRIDVQQRH